MNIQRNLKRVAGLLAFGGVATLLSGCVVAPLGYDNYGAYPSARHTPEQMGIHHSCRNPKARPHNRTAAWRHRRTPANRPDVGDCVGCSWIAPVICESEPIQFTFTANTTCPMAAGLSDPVSVH